MRRRRLRPQWIRLVQPEQCPHCGGQVCPSWPPPADPSPVLAALAEVTRLRAELDCATAFTVGRVADGTEVTMDRRGHQRHWWVYGIGESPAVYPTRAAAMDAARRALKEM